MIPVLQYFLEAPRGRCVEKHVAKRFPELHEILCNLNPGSAKYAERIYMHYHHLTEPPKCAVCGKPTKYIDLSRGYGHTCSQQCSTKWDGRAAKISAAQRNRSDEEIVMTVAKRRRTCMERYGVENASQAKSVKQKVKQTCMERYGGMGLASDTIKAKAYQTNQERYGGTNPHCSTLSLLHI